MSKAGLSYVVVAVTGAFVALVSACSNDFSNLITDAPDSGSSPSPSSNSMEDPKAPPAASDGGSQVDAASQGDAAKLDGGDSGTLKPNGSPCSKDSDNSIECKSGFCKEQNSGGKNGFFCTVECDNDGQDDPKCAPTPPFTGKCGSGGDCIVQ